MTGVVIVSFPDDAHGTALESVVRAHGAQVIRTSLRDVAEGFTWELGPGSTSSRTSAAPAWRGIWRRPGIPAISGIEERFADFAASETRDAFRGAWLGRGVSWINEPASLWRAEHKLLQLTCARDLGIRVPDTIVTNDPGVARGFAARRAVIAKPVRYGLVASTPEPRMAWTQHVEAEPEFDFAGVPVLFQEALRAKVHLRVATVGEQAFVSQLISDALDWRAGPISSQLWEALEPGDVPPGVANDAVRLAQGLKLNYTSQDWLVDDTSRPAFLEANPNGQWLFLDGEAPGRVTEAIADWLTGGEETSE